MNATDQLTQDVCPLDYPPVSYGQSLAEVEATVQDVIERVFRDEDGMLRSFVNARTMKAYEVADVKNRPDGVGAFTERSDIPTRAKPVWLNYENAGQASGVYIEALCAKVLVTGDQKFAKLAANTVEAVAKLWENAAQMPFPNGGAGRGWFPKPYLGIQNLEGMHECSADQYCEITLGLHSYYLTLAGEEEKRLIERIITSFAEWWYDHDYAGIYFGRAIWWKRLTDHPMAVSFFLYLNALAYSIDPRQKFRRGFEIWLENKDSLTQPADPIWVCLNGLSLKCLERLLTLRPELSAYWQHSAAHQAASLLKGFNEPKGLNAIYEINSYCADFLTTAHRLFPNAGYRDAAVKALKSCTTRNGHYHLQRGKPVENLSQCERGDDFIDALQCENHVHWLSAYWTNPQFR